MTVHHTPAINSRLPRVGTTIFTVMSALAQQHNAVNLGQGFPDFNCDPLLLDAVDKAMRSGLNQYPPMAGVLTLREAVAQKIEALYRHVYDPASEITITAGATQAIFTIIMAIVHPGDEVIVLDPCYDSYEPNIVLAGGVAVHVQELSRERVRLLAVRERPSLAAVSVRKGAEQPSLCQKGLLLFRHWCHCCSGAGGLSPAQQALLDGSETAEAHCYLTGPK